MDARFDTSTDTHQGGMNGNAVHWPSPDTIPHPLTSFDSATREAFLQGHDEGERVGYVAGWRWGATCGAFAGMAACALLAFALGLIVGGP